MTEEASERRRIRRDPVARRDGGRDVSKIARKYYGDASLYMQIFEANRDQLKDPDLIKVGQKLRIP
jgi:hypothetical protein